MLCAPVHVCMCGIFSRKSCGSASRLKQLGMGMGGLGRVARYLISAPAGRLNLDSCRENGELSMQVEGEAVPEQGQWVGMRGR